MEYIVKICRMTKAFYEDYPASQYPEILRKEKRPYNCFLLEIDANYICIPFKSNIKHKEAFFFKNTKRSRKGRSGLDYKKTLIVSNSKYIDLESIIVDRDEYKIVLKNAERIAKEITDYITIYKDYLAGVSTISEEKFNKKYRFSTLKYFVKPGERPSRSGQQCCERLSAEKCQAKQRAAGPGPTLAKGPASIARGANRERII